MEVIRNILPDLNNKQISAALRMSKNIPETAIAILVSKNPITIKALQKEINCLQFLNNIDLLKIITNYLSIHDNINLLKTSKFTHNVIYNIVYPLSNIYKNIVNKLLLETANEFLSHLKWVYDKDNRDNEPYIKNKLEFIDGIDRLLKSKVYTKLPEQLQTFIVILKKIPVDSISYINVSNLEEEFINSKSRKHEYINVLYKYAGMGHWCSISYINGIDSNKKYFFSHMGGSNGWESGDREQCYNEKNIEDLRLMDFFEIINIFISNDGLSIIKDLNI